MNHLLLIDIDGTFVYDSSKVESKDLEAFKQAQTSCLMSIATGRSIAEIAHIEKSNQIKLDYKIGFNGALILDKQNKVMYDRPIEKQSLLDLVDYLETRQIIFDALDGTNRLGNFKHEAKDQLLGLDYQYMENPYQEIRTRKVYKVNLRPNNLEEATRVTDELKRKFPKLSIFQVGKRRIEISADQTSKGIALDKIAGDTLKTVAIGDSENDISMFEEADISYCMAHAPEHVKEKANYVVPRFSDAVTHLFQEKAAIQL